MGSKLTLKSFIENAICNLNNATFISLKEMLLEKYISFSFVEPEEIDNSVLAEKIFDYFLKVQIKTNMSFDKIIETYMKDIDSIVKDKIAPSPQSKNENDISKPRSRKYYDKFVKYIDKENKNFTILRDFSRIMFCLYTEIMDNKGKLINNFNYSLDCLNPTIIVDAMKSETVSGLFGSIKPRFDINDEYGINRCTMVLSIILLHSIINSKIQGGNENE